MQRFFSINFELDKEEVHRRISERLQHSGSDYVCVADGNVTAKVHQSEEYRKVVNDGLFSISDSSWTPVFLKIIHGIKCDAYTGSDIFSDIVGQSKYKMAFLGGSKESLIGLRNHMLNQSYPEENLCFVELPFLDVTDFNYKEISEILNSSASDIIWIGLGAPKQEVFMSKLQPYLKHGVMIGVGAVFNFYGGTTVKRAPAIVRRMHLEFLYRILSEPKKQMSKFSNYLKVLPGILYKEFKQKKAISH